MNLWKLFGIDKKDENNDFGVLFEGIEKIMGNEGDEQIKRVTGVAGLLGKVAYADSEISKSEIDRIQKVLKETFELDSGTIHEIVTLLQEQKARLYRIEDYIYARFVNDVYSKEQKKKLVHCLLGVAAADGTIDPEEEAAIRLIATSLRLEHRDFIDARTAYKHALSIFQSNT